MTKVGRHQEEAVQTSEEFLEILARRMRERLPHPLRQVEDSSEEQYEGPTLGHLAFALLLEGQDVLDSESP